MQRPPDTVATYTDGDWQGKLYLYRPRSPGPHPAILFLHGGAWQTGHASQFYPQCQVFSRLGYVCASASYRVAERDGTRPEQALADGVSALAYLIENAHQLHIDPKRVIVGGGSAGGHLAALLATQQAGKVAALLLLNPMLDLSPGRPDHRYVAHDWLALSPLHQLRHALPPTLILVGDQDREVPLSTVEAYCERAREFGGICEMVIAKGQGHGFFNRSHSRWQFYLSIFRMQRFLKARHLAP